MTDNRIVPFGKYKGQPVDVMLGDRDYVQWLMAQGWFREKPLYQMIINYGAEPQETPEHNAMQVLFLDPAFCERFVRCVAPDFEAKARRGLVDEITRAREKKWSFSNEERTHMEMVGTDYKFSMTFSAKFEISAWDNGSAPVDVLLRGMCEDKRLPFLGYSFFRRAIEIKPSVSDDYPAVLRQMKGNHADILLTRDYTGQGATREQFVALFKTAGIIVIFLDEIA